MLARTLVRITIAALAAGAITAPALAGGNPEATVEAETTLPELKGFTRVLENGVAVFRGRAPVHKAYAPKNGPCSCGGAVRVKTTVVVINRNPPAHLRTQGFYSGKGRRSHRFTHGFYSG